MRQVPMAEKRIARYTADPNAPKKDIEIEPAIAHGAPDQTKRAVSEHAQT